MLTLDFDGFTVASDHSAPPERERWGYRVPGAELALQHPFGGEADFCRHGWNSWSPTGWVRLDGATLGIRNSPGRLLTADDASLETIDTHSGSAVGATFTICTP